MKRSVVLLFVLLGALLSCNPDELNPLIKKYTLEKNSDVLFRKYQGENLFPLSKEQFYGLHVNADGSLFVVHQDFTVGRFTISHLTSQFEFLANKDFNETAGFVSRSSSGEMIVQSFQGNNWVFRRWDQTLTESAKSVVAMPTYYVRFAVNNSNYYTVDAVSGTQRISKYNLEGQEQWTNPLANYGAKFNVRQIFSEHSDDFFLISDNAGYDSLSIALVNHQNGELRWSSRFKKTELTESGAVNYFLPSSNGDLLLNGTDSADPGIIHITRINNKGSVTHMQKVALPDGNDSQAGPMLEETDGGLLVGLATDWTKEVASFRLLKTDSKLNGGWVGSFTQISSGTISAIKKLPTGEVIVLTSNGYLYQLKPEQ